MDFLCGACPSGFRGTGVGANGCADIDECAESAPCDLLTQCTNTPGSFQCSAQSHARPWRCRPRPFLAFFCSRLLARLCGAHFNLVAVVPESCLGSASRRPPRLTEQRSSDISVCRRQCLSYPRCIRTVSAGACPPSYRGTGASGCRQMSSCSVNNGGCVRITTHLPPILSTQLPHFSPPREVDSPILTLVPISPLSAHTFAGPEAAVHGHANGVRVQQLSGHIQHNGRGLHPQAGLHNRACCVCCAVVAARI